MKISDLKPAEGSAKKTKRIGRGVGSGHGKTATKGHKGQKARAGGGTKPGFEGGQMPLHRRLPKRGFTNPFGKMYVIVNLDTIENSGLTEIDPVALLENGIIKKLGDGVKILGTGTLTKVVTVKANAFSASAEKKIAEAGGKVEVI